MRSAQDALCSPYDGSAIGLAADCAQTFTQYRGKTIMDISYRNERVKEPTGKARCALIDLIWACPKGGALDRLLDGKDVPATKVLSELDELLARPGEISRREIAPHRAILEDFRKIVLRRIEEENADRLADKLARQVFKAGIGYGGAQSLFIRALDRMNADWPDEGRLLRYIYQPD